MLQGGTWKVPYPQFKSIAIRSENEAQSQTHVDSGLSDSYRRHFDSAFQSKAHNNQWNNQRSSLNLKLDRCGSSRGIWYTRGYGILFSFFMRPSLEVVLGQRIQEPEVPEAESRYGTSPEPKSKEIVSQSLLVKAKKQAITKLRAMTWLGDNGAQYFLWPIPQAAIEAGRIRIHEASKYIDSLVPEEEVRLPIWIARKTDEHEEIMFYTEGQEYAETRRWIPFKEFQADRPYRFEVQFIGENYSDKKPRRFRLNAQSWQSLGLTEVP